MAAKSKIRFFGGIQAVISAAVLLGFLLPFDCFAADQKENINDKKIKIILQAISYRLLEEKKSDITPEDILPLISNQIPLIPEGTHGQVKPQFDREVRLRYKVFLIGDYLSISGNAVIPVSGRYISRTRQGIRVGNHFIPWSDLTPEIAAQFHYRSLMKLRANYYNVYVDGKWISPVKFIQDINGQIKTQSKINNSTSLWLLLGCCVVAGLIGANIGYSSKSKKAIVILALIGIVVGVFVQMQIIKYLENRRKEAALSAFLEKTYPAPPRSEDKIVPDTEEEPKVCKYSQVEEILPPSPEAVNSF